MSVRAGQFTVESDLAAQLNAARVCQVSGRRRLAAVQRSLFAQHIDICCGYATGCNYTPNRSYHIFLLRGP